MENTTVMLEGLREQLATVVAAVFDDAMMHAASDVELLEAVTAAGDVQRLVEAVLVEGVAEIVERSRQRDRAERLTTRVGCHDVNELVQRLTRCGPHTAARLENAQRGVATWWDPVGGEGRPAKLPAMRDALRDGHVGVDGVVAVAGPMLRMRDRVDRFQVLAADAAIAAFARGDGPDEQPAASADLLRVQAEIWSCALDQDGDEPADRDTARRRSFVLGTPKDGLVPFHGNAVPELAAQMQRILDAINSPYLNKDGTAAPGGVRFTEPGTDSRRVGRVGGT